MKTILVPTDFSRIAHNACLYAIAIAKKMKAKILLVHAFDTPLLFADVPIVTTDMDYKVFREAAEKNLRKYYKKIAPLVNGVKVELMTKSGLASARITELALAKRVDLIVMGTTGQGRIGRMIIGSNTIRVIADAPCMTLAVPPHAKYKDWEKIVYATDLSEDNLKYANSVAQFVKPFKTELIFLHIAGLMEKVDDNEYSDNILKKLKKHVIYKKTSAYVLTDLNITEGVNHFMKHHKADCLAMYTRHRSVMKKLFTRSITKALSLHTIVPLLVVHETDL